MPRNMYLVTSAFLMHKLTKLYWAEASRASHFIVTKYLLVNCSNCVPNLAYNAGPRPDVIPQMAHVHLATDIIHSTHVWDISGYSGANADPHATM